MNINLTKERAQKIIVLLLNKEEEMEADWFDGYKSGIVEFLVTVGITVDELFSHAGYEVESAKLPQKNK